MTTLDPNTLNRDNRRKILPRGEYTLGWPDFASMPTPPTTDAEKRRIIAEKLSVKMVLINTVKWTKDTFRGDGISPGEVEATFQMAGTTFARAYYDGTDKTGEIKKHHPIVFDTVTGKCITGINKDWGADEYRVVGISLSDFKTPPNGPGDTYTGQTNVIPIRLVETMATPTENAIIKVSGYRIPGRFAHDNKEYAGIGTGYPVTLSDENIPSLSGSYSRLDVEDGTDGGSRKVSLIYNLHQRDIRPNSYVYGVPYGKGYLPVTVFW